jgi:hypothetical protein
LKAGWYFENEVWEQTVDVLKNGTIGDIAAVSVQVVCTGKEIPAEWENWDLRLRELLGEPVRMDTLECTNSLSVIACYQGNVIARVFIDNSIGGYVTDFEIVCKNGLLLWKPDVHALSVINTENKSDAIYELPLTSLKGETL